MASCDSNKKQVKFSTTFVHEDLLSSNLCAVTTDGGKVAQQQFCK